MTPTPDIDPDIDPAEVLADRKRRQKKSRRTLDYRCDGCGRQVGRNNLKVKRVQFLDIGVGGKVDKSRTLGWFCIVPQDNGDPSCVEADPDWNRQAILDAPGVRQGRVEAKTDG